MNSLECNATYTVPMLQYKKSDVTCELKLESITTYHFL